MRGSLSPQHERIKGLGESKPLSKCHAKDVGNDKAIRCPTYITSSAAGADRG